MIPKMDAREYSWIMLFQPVDGDVANDVLP